MERESILRTQQELIQLGEQQARQKLQKQTQEDSFRNNEEIIKQYFPEEDGSDQNPNQEDYERVYTQLRVGKTNKETRGLIKAYHQYSLFQRNRLSELQQEVRQVKDDLRTSEEEGEEQLQQMEEESTSKQQENRSLGQRIVKLHAKCKARNVTIKILYGGLLLSNLVTFLVSRYGLGSCYRVLEAGGQYVMAVLTGIIYLLLQMGWGLVWAFCQLKIFGTVLAWFGRGGAWSFLALPALGKVAVIGLALYGLGRGYLYFQRHRLAAIQRAGRKVA